MDEMTKLVNSGWTNASRQTPGNSAGHPLIGKKNHVVKKHGPFNQKALTKTEAASHQATRLTCSLEMCIIDLIFLASMTVMLCLHGLGWVLQQHRHLIFVRTQRLAKQLAQCILSQRAYMAYCTLVQSLLGLLDAPQGSGSSSQVFRLGHAAIRDSPAQILPTQDSTTSPTRRH